MRLRSFGRCAVISTGMISLNRRETRSCAESLRQSQSSRRRVSRACWCAGPSDSHTTSMHTSPLPGNAPGRQMACTRVQSGGSTKTCKLVFPMSSWARTGSSTIAFLLGSTSSAKREIPPPSPWRRLNTTATRTTTTVKVASRVLNAIVRARARAHRVAVPREWCICSPNSPRSCVAFTPGSRL